MLPLARCAFVRSYQRTALAASQVDRGVQLAAEDAGERDAKLMNVSKMENSQSRQHIIIVEDDAGLRMLITRALRENGYNVTACRSGAELWQLFPNAGVDLVLMDSMLPGPSGLDLLKELRTKNSVPVVMISARNEEADRVLGLEMGADDYIAKPFGRPELLARVRAVLRRTSAAPSDPGAARPKVLSFSGWRLDLLSRILIDPEGANIDLSAAEYDLLVVFLNHPGRVLLREQILEMSRSRIGSPSDRSVDSLVRRLRRKLEPPEGMPHLIKTVHRAGYMLISKVTRE